MTYFFEKLLLAPHAFSFLLILRTLGAVGVESKKIVPILNFGPRQADTYPHTSTPGQADTVSHTRYFQHPGK